jgi:hypothetical protein
MELYVVMGGQGERSMDRQSFLGVYSSEKLAEDALKKFMLAFIDEFDCEDGAIEDLMSQENVQNESDLSLSCVQEYFNSSNDELEEFYIEKRNLDEPIKE